MKLLRNGVVIAAVAALLVVPLSVASAATATVVVTPDDMAGWTISPSPNVTTSAFVPGPAPVPIGTGSVQFGPIANAGPLDGKSKFIIQREESIPSAAYGGVSFDYYIAPTSGNKSPEQFYLNLHAVVAGSSTGFYDCSYDYVATTAGDGWHTLSVLRATTTPTVRFKANGSTAICGSSPAALVGGRINRIVLNGGDTGISDEAMRGGFDKVVVTGADTTTYDFEPAEVTACDAQPGPGIVGTAGNNAVQGTAAGERIDLLGGNDIADALGGADCVLGGDGADRLKAGDGDDEVLGGTGVDVIDAGTGADIVDPGTGRDTVNAGAGDDRVFATDGGSDVVDCGPGVDTVKADVADVLRDCELVTRG